MSSGGSSLGIDSYGVSMTTLEEIFLKLGEEEEAKKEEQELQVMNKGKKKTKKDPTTEVVAEVRMSGAGQLPQPSNGVDNIVTQDLATSPRPEDKDMTGYSFEAVATTKSKWQIFKALVYVSSSQNRASYGSACPPWRRCRFAPFAKSANPAP